MKSVESVLKCSSTGGLKEDVLPCAVYQKGIDIAAPTTTTVHPVVQKAAGIAALAHGCAEKLNFVLEIRLFVLGSRQT